MTAEAVDIARRWRAAAEANSMDEFRALYSATATIWSSRDRHTLSVDDHMAAVAKARSMCEEWEYLDVRCQSTDTGFVCEHTVRFGRGGREWTTTAAIIGIIEAGCIAHLAEYLGTPVETVTVPNAASPS